MRLIVRLPQRLPVVIGWCILDLYTKWSRLWILPDCYAPILPTAKSEVTTLQNSCDLSPSLLFSFLFYPSGALTWILVCTWVAILSCVSGGVCRLPEPITIRCSSVGQELVVTTWTNCKAQHDAPNYLSGLNSQPDGGWKYIPYWMSLALVSYAMKRSDQLFCLFEAFPFFEWVAEFCSGCDVLDRLFSYDSRGKLWATIFVHVLVSMVPQWPACVVQYEKSGCVLRVFLRHPSRMSMIEVLIMELSYGDAS